MAANCAVPPRTRGIVCSVLVVVSLFFQTPPADAADTTDIVPGWPAGQQDTLTFRHRIAARSAGSLVRDEDYRGEIEIRVLSRSTDGYRLTWRYRNVTKNGKSFTEQPDLGVAMSADGAELSLENTDEIRAQIEAQLDRTSPGSGPGYDGALTRRDLEAFARDKALIEAFYLKDAQQYFLPLGISLTPDGRSESSATLAAGFSGNLEAQDRWTLWKEADSEAVIGIEFRQVLVPPASKDLLDGALDKDFPFLAGIDRIAKKGAFVLGRRHYWPVRSMVVQDSTRGTLRQIETWEFRSKNLGHLVEKPASGED